MNLIKIKDFSEIDFVSADPSRDRFQLPNGEIYRFSDHMCDLCWTAGTVMESEEKQKRFHCVMCNHQLIWSAFQNDFLPPTGDDLSFLLPADWSDQVRQEWYREFKQRRLAQEKIREDILDQGKE